MENLAVDVNSEDQQEEQGDGRDDHDGRWQVVKFCHHSKLEDTHGCCCLNLVFGRELKAS